MADKNKHTLTVAFVGATDMVLEISYTNVSDMQRARYNLTYLDIPQGYPYHPAWAMLGGISGVFAEGVSTAHVAPAGVNVPDILIPWHKMHSQTAPQDKCQPA